MIRVSRFVFSLLLLATMVACATTAPDRTVTAHDPGLEGLWQGSITITSTPDNPLGLRLLVDQEAARVWLELDGAWVEAKPGAFRMEQSMGNAVIQATDSGVDADGKWVETWAIVATLRSPDSMLMAWSRVVNNLDLPPEHESGSYAEQGSGVLHRVSSEVE